MLTKDMKRNYIAVDFLGYYRGERLYKTCELHIQAPKPKFNEKTQRAKWNGEKWEIEDLPKRENSVAP